MQSLEWLMAFKKPFFRLTHRSKLIHEGFSKMRHGPDPQSKAFPVKMFQVQGWHNHWNGKWLLEKAVLKPDPQIKADSPWFFKVKGWPGAYIKACSPGLFAFEA